MAATGAYALIGGHDLLMQIAPPVPALMAKEWAINFWPESCTLGLLVCLNIYGFAGVSKYANDAVSKYASTVRSIADTSFGLYLFHYPLMYFVKALLAATGLSNGWAYTLILYVVPFWVSVVLALKCEVFKCNLAKILESLAKKAGYRKRQRSVVTAESMQHIQTRMTNHVP